MTEKRWYIVKYQLLTDKPSAHRTMLVQETHKVEAATRVLECHKRCVILSVGEITHDDQTIEGTEKSA